MEKIETLSDFLHQAGAKYCVFDMGRRVIKLTPDEFVGFEGATKPYPYPFQKMALFAVIFCDPSSLDEHYVWFLRFPLDEQGLLVQAARDEFLVTVLERVGACLLAEGEGKKIEGALKDSPYSFNPREDKMAAFNAQATSGLNLPASQFYEDALKYFTGQSDLDKWQHLGMQGVADFVIRMDGAEQTLSLIETLPNLPDEPFMVLTSFLEHGKPVAGIVEVLDQLLLTELQEKQPNVHKVAACLRAASNGPAHGLLQKMVDNTLKHDCCRHIEVLATISGRCWTTLKHAQTCQNYVEQLARNDAGHGAFDQVLADLMFLPSMRPYIMAALRSPERSIRLTRAIGKMLG